MFGKMVLVSWQKMKARVQLCMLKNSQKCFPESVMIEKRKRDLRNNGFILISRVNLPGNEAGRAARRRT